MCKMEFQYEERVYMMLNNDSIGIGCMCRLDPNSTCTGTKIGQGNVSLLVEESLKDVELPFPTIDAIFLKNAIWTNAGWPKILLRHFTRELEFGDWGEKCNDLVQEAPMEASIVNAIPISSSKLDMQNQLSGKNVIVLLNNESMI